MIIRMDGLGKILIQRHLIKTAIKNSFERNDNVFDETTSKKEFNPIKDHHDVSKYQYDISFYNKVNHNDLPYLCLMDKEKKSTSFKEVVGGYKEVTNSGLLDSEFSSAVFDVFVFLKMYAGSNYQIIMVRPVDTMNTFTIGETTYWGIIGYKGNVFFSENARDNIGTLYDDKTGQGIKFIIQDKYNNSLEVAKVDAIFKDRFPVGINFEIDLDALTAIMCNKSKALYGSPALTDEVHEFISGDTYKEKLIDSLIGILGIYKSFESISNVNNNILKIYFDVIASITVIRNIDDEELREIILSVMKGLHKEDNDLIDYIINTIKPIKEAINNEAGKHIYYEGYTPKSFHEAAVYKIYKENSKHVRTIKKPQ